MRIAENGDKVRVVLREGLVWFEKGDGEWQEADSHQNFYDGKRFDDQHLSSST